MKSPLALATAAVGAVGLSLSAQAPAPPAPVKPNDTSAAKETAFEFPTGDYRRGLRGRGNFGVLIDRAESPFAGSWHLAEDVWLPAGTSVRSITAGVVRYSDFSPSWKDRTGRMHWNLGNVVVIEHPLDPPIDGLTAVCSVYVHLGADRRVKVGDAVEKGQVIGSIGRDRSEENGLYPAHLHFGIHKGPYIQIAPSLRRELETAAKTTGLAFGAAPPIRGEIEIELHGEDSVLVKSKKDDAKFLLSLLVGSTAPKDKPADIVGWCKGYGDQETVAEWLRPSQWIAERQKEAAANAPAPAGSGVPVTK